MTHEEPTMEFRQVKHRYGTFVENHIYYTVQQKWVIHEEIDPSFPYGGKIGRDEWRDLPVVDAKDAK